MVFVRSMQSNKILAIQGHEGIAAAVAKRVATPKWV